MLKVTIHDNVEMLRFQVEGVLAGRGVQELEQCWRTASSTLGQRALQIDLRDMTEIDDAGRNLLQELRARGANVVKTKEPPEKKSWLLRFTRGFAVPD